MIQALTPNGTNYPLHIGSLPRRSRRGQHFVDAHVSHLFSELIAEDSIAVAHQVARDLVKGECFPQLLPCPLRGGVGRHIAVNNATPVMGQYQKHVKNLETDGGHSKEVDGDHLREVVPEESAPGLRRRLAAAHHVLAHTGLTDVDAEFEQFTVDAGCTPPGILPAHLADQVSNLARNERPSRLAAADLPGPEPAKAGAMPGYDRLGLNYGQRRAPVPPNAGEKDPQPAVPSGQFRAFCRRPLKHADLMAQSEVLEFEGSARAENSKQSGEECREKNEHRRKVYESSINGSRSDISRFSRATVPTGTDATVAAAAPRRPRSLTTPAGSAAPAATARAAWRPACRSSAAA